MKIARLLLLAALLLSAFSTSALASDQAIGYIQLLPQPQGEAPIAAQTHHVLQELMPRLLAARAAGRISNFQVSPNSGVMQIVYRSSAGLPDLGGRTVYSRIEDAAAAMGPRPAITCSAPLFWMYLYDNYFAAGCLTPGAYVVGSLREPSGRAVANMSAIVDIAGNISYSYFVWGHAFSYAVPGYTVTFKEYVGGVLTATFKTKLPNIKFISINRASAIVQGTGPAGKLATLNWSHNRWDAAHSTLSVTKNRIISSAGIWKVDFGTVPIRGGDHIHADVFPTGNFEVSNDMDVPAMYCRLGSNYCELNGFALTPATIQIIHGGQTYNFSGSFDEWGYFWAELRTPTGAPIFLVPYDKISGTGVAQYGLPNLTANINYTTNTITGKAPPYKYFNVWVYQGSTSNWYNVYAHSNGSGVYSANFTASLDLLAGNPYVVEIEFTLPSTGNFTDMHKTYGP